MTSPNIDIKPPAIADAAAALRTVAVSAGEVGTRSVAAIAAVAAKPLPAGTKVGPEIAAITAVMERVNDQLRTAAGDLRASADTLDTWEQVELGHIDTAGAAAVQGVEPAAAPATTASGGGGSW